MELDEPFTRIVIREIAPTFFLEYSHSAGWQYRSTIDLRLPPEGLLIGPADDGKHCPIMWWQILSAYPEWTEGVNTLIRGFQGRKNQFHLIDRGAFDHMSGNSALYGDWTQVVDGFRVSERQIFIPFAEAGVLVTAKVSARIESFAAHRVAFVAFLDSLRLRRE